MPSTHPDLNGEFTITQDTVSHGTPNENSSTEQKSQDGSPLGMFSHFVEYPTNCSIQDLDPDEKVALILRSHFIVNAPWITLTVILLVVPLILLAFESVIPFIRLDVLTKILLVLVYYLIVFGYAFLNFVLWYFQVTVITTKKILDMDLNGILSRQVNEAPLESIQDIEYTQKGMLASFWNYGDILMQTETRTQNLEVVKAPHPARAVDIISELISAKGGHV